MRSITRQLAVVTLVGAGFLWGKAHTDRDLAKAQTRKPIMVTRIYTGPDGLSHAEEIEMKMTDRGISEFKAASAQFSSRPALPITTGIPVRGGSS